MENKESRSVAIVGSGPAALMAAWILVDAGIRVELFDQNKSMGVKFLLAGASGMNISNSQVCSLSPSRYLCHGGDFKSWLKIEGSDELRKKLLKLDIELFEGSGGRLFPKDITTRELLKRWINRLQESGLFQFHPFHKLLNININKIHSAIDLKFSYSDGNKSPCFSSVILALGGASRPETGSTGLWTPMLETLGIRCAKWKPSNCGFEILWSDKMQVDCRYTYLKNCGVLCDGILSRGDLSITPYGLEGNPLYFHSSALRHSIETNGAARVFIDLFPDLTSDEIAQRLMGDKGKQTLFHYLRKKLKMDKIAFSILMEFSTPIQREKGNLSHLLKALPVELKGMRPLSEAISSAGGVELEQLTDELQFLKVPGLYFAGEMLDWEAPTGGFLIQGCFATGAAAARGVINSLV